MFCKKVLLEISQNSQENTCASLFLQAQLYLKRNSGTVVFLWFYEIFVITFFTEHLQRLLQSVQVYLIVKGDCKKFLKKPLLYFLCNNIWSETFLFYHKTCFPSEFYLLYYNGIFKDHVILRLRVTQKALKLPLFSSFSFSLQQLWSDWPKFLVKFSSCVKLEKCGLIQTHWENITWQMFVGI